MEIAKELGLAGVFGMIAIIGWFLRQKDEQQAKSIALLFQKHDEDADELGKLKLEIAKGYYLKHELDARFLSLETTFKTGMNELGAKFDKLSNILIEHVAREDQRQ